jgi:glycerol-3-phosphate acyltransferase PlsY
MLLQEFGQVLICTIIAYLIGSLPISLLISKVLYGINIHEHGDGTSSHANVFSVMGWEATAIVVLLNILKGYLGACLGYFMHRNYGILSDSQFPILELSLGFAVTFGHVLPVFANFQGNKGVFCAIGVIFAVSPVLSLALISVAAISLLIFRYRTLAYVFGSLSLPLLVLISPSYFEVAQHFVPTLVFSCLLTVLLLITMRHTIGQFWRGEEAQFKLNDLHL